MKRLCVVLFVIGLTAPHCFPTLASATQVQYQSVEMMGASAQRIVRATVASVRPYWNDSRTRILTETTIEISEDYKGAGPATVRLIQFGGVVDDVRMTVAGALSWIPGEEVVLFLEESLPGRHRVSGFSQGKYSVQHDPVTGQAFVRQAGLGAAELSGAPLEELRSRMPLGELLDRAMPAIEGGE
jgi:hypothetical protein